MDRYLILENGMIFKGKGFGADGEVYAEIVFTTAMTGYLETLTDKSYTGQAVVQTFPLIGNYGVIPADAEGDRIGAAAYIVRECCEVPSNFRSEGDLNSYLKKNGIVGLQGIDTRGVDTGASRERCHEWFHHGPSGPGRHRSSFKVPHYPARRGRIAA